MSIIEEYFQLLQQRSLESQSKSVNTFAEALTFVTTGQFRQFIIKNNELYSESPTQSIFDGTNWYHSPAHLKND